MPLRSRGKDPDAKNVEMQRCQCVFDDFSSWGVDVTLEPGC